MRPQNSNGPMLIVSPERAMGQALSAREVSNYWLRAAWSDIRDDPFGWFALMLRKSLLVINRDEVPDMESLSVHRMLSPPLMLSWFYHFGILLPLAAGSFWMARSNEHPMMSITLWLWWSLAIAVVAFFILGRYRQPLAVLAMPAAAHVLNGIQQKFNLRNGRAGKPPEPGPQRRTVIHAAPIAVVSVGILCNLPIQDQRSLRATSAMNVATAAASQGQWSEARLWLRRSEAIQADIPEIQFNFGRVERLTGHPNAALQRYATAIELDPGFWPAHEEAITLLDQLGYPEAAGRQRRELERLRRRDPR